MADVRVRFIGGAEVVLAGVERIEPASNVGTPVKPTVLAQMEHLLAVPEAPKVSTEVFNLVAALEQTLVRCDTCERAVARRYAQDHSFGMFTCHRCVNAHAVGSGGKPAGRNDPDWSGWEATRKRHKA